jgi:hypothetical protein
VAGEWDIARIRSESGDENAHFLHGQVQASIYTRQEDGRSVYEPLRVGRALAVGGLFLIEAEDEPDNWYIGQMAKDDGSIECWGQYGALSDAIRGL